MNLLCHERNSFKHVQVKVAVYASILFMIVSMLSHAVYAEGMAPGDIVYKGSGKRLSFPEATFRHWKHRQRYRCSVCHEKIFISQRGANKTSMKEMEEGRYCGACHNGKEAFNIEFANCTRCHKSTAPAGEADVVKTNNTFPDGTKEK